MNKKRDIGEIVLTIVGVVTAVLVVAEWTFFYLLMTGVINITQ